MLDAMPDLRETIKNASDSELGEIFRAFEVSVVLGKTRQVLHLAARVAPDLTENEHDCSEERSRVAGVAGAVSRRVPATGFRISGRWDLTAKRWIT
jgi:hypothetical protein